MLQCVACVEGDGCRQKGQGCGGRKGENTREETQRANQEKENGERVGRGRMNAKERERGGESARQKDNARKSAFAVNTAKCRVQSA